MDNISEKEQLKEFGLWLSKRRESCGYSSQRQLSLKSGVSPATISRIESGIQKAEPDTLARLAPYLSISHEELMAIAGYIDIRDVERIVDPAPKDLEEFLKESNIEYDGAPLSEEEKESVLGFLKLAIDTIRKKQNKKKT
ncbi:MAG: helix-turn-helix transcriptional regulator [Clostridia bacterium]|nr:helix-turn-helix transcriptional regulator [Clostridia bacterium]